MAQTSSTNVSSLPGIVTDQPEIYESEPTLSDDTGINDLDTASEPTDEAIAVIEVPIKQAFSYFAERESEIAQFYVQRYGEYKISGVKSDESDIEKYHRLVAEVNELLNKFQAEKVAKLDKTELSAIRSLDHNSLTSNLEVLSRQLKAIEFAAEDGTLDPCRSGFTSIEKKLKSLSEDSGPKEDALVEPTSDKAQETTRMIKMSALERRLNLLESVLGLSETKTQTLFSITSSSSLIDSIDTLSSWLSLFHPDNVQKVKRELDFMTQRLEAIEERTSQEAGDLEPKFVARLDQLCELVTSTDKYRGMVPTIIHRLSAMEELQRKAAQVAVTVTHLEQIQSQILEGLDSNKQEISSLNKMFTKNMELIKEYSRDIDSRISNIRNKRS